MSAPTETNRKSPAWILRSGLVAALVLSFSLQPAQAQTIWGNTAIDFNANGSWSANTPTAAVGVFQAGTVSFNPRLSASINVVGLQFDVGTAGWTFSGNSGTRILGIGASGIVSNASTTQTFNQGNLRVDLTTNTAFTSNNAGALSFGSTLAGFRLAGFTLTLSGNSTSSSNLIAEPIVNGTGTGKLTKSGTGTWTLSGTNTYTGATTINGGTLSVSTINNGGVAGNLGNASNAAANLVLGGGTLRYTGSTASTNRNFTLTAGTTSTIDVTTNTLTISGASTGTTGALTKAGNGTLTMSGTNLYTGATTINAGVLSVATIGNGGVAGNLGNASNAAANLVLGGGTLRYTGATASTNRNFTLTAGTTSTIDVTTNNLTISGNSTSTTGALTKAGNGTLTLSGPNAYTGATNVSVGVLNIQNATALGTTAAGTTVAGNAALQIQGGITVGAETLSLNGTGVSSDGALRNISGTNTMGGAVTLASATRINSDAGTLTLTGGITATNQNLTIGGAGNTTVSTTGITIGSGSLTKDGAGTLTIGGTNTYTGGTALSAGTLTVNSGASLAGATGTVTITGGTLNLNNTAQTVASLTGSVGTVNLGASHTLTLNDTGSTAFTGTLSSTNSTAVFNKSGTGTYTLSGNNSGYTGVVNVASGTLLAASSNALGTGTGTSTVSSGAALGLSGSGLAVSNGTASITIAGNGTSNSGAIYNVSGSNTLNSSISLSSAARMGSAAGTLTLGPAKPAFSASGHTQPTENSYITLGDATNGSNLTFSGAGNIVVNSRIQDYTGQTAGMSFTNATTVNYQPTPPSGTAGNVTIDMTTGSASVTYQANANSYTGTTFVKNGTLILNTYANTVAPHDTVTDSFHAINGPLVIGNGSTTGKVQIYDGFGPNEPISINSPVTLYSDGTLDLNNASSTIDTLTFVTGGTVLTGGGKLYLNNDVFFNSTVSGQTAKIGNTVNDGELSLELNKATGTDVDNGIGATRTFTITPVDINSTATLTVNAKVIRGDVVKEGTGTLVFAGNNTYLGTTSVNGGILLATRGDDGSFFNAFGSSDGSDAKGTTVADGATVQLSGGITISKEKLNLSGEGFNGAGALQNLSGNNTWGAIGNINLILGARINSDAGSLLTITSNVTSTGNDKALIIGGAGNTTVSGQISTGTGSTTTLTKDGTGTLTLAGSNSYQGLTDIQSGIVVASHNNSLGSALGGTQVTSGAELRLTNTITIPGEATTLNGTGFNSGGTGALRNYSGSNTYQGPLTIGSAGTRINSDTGTLTLTGGISSGGNAFTVGGAGNTTETGAVGGSGALTKDGAGTAIFSNIAGLGSITKNDAGALTFSGSSTTGGTVNMNAGTLTFNGATATVGQVHLLGGASSTINVGLSATLNTDEFDSTSLSTLNIATGGTVVATYDTGNTTFSGQITGGGTFKAFGPGQVTFDQTINNSSLIVYLGGTSVGTNASPLTFSITNNAHLTFKDLYITGDTILDFGNSSASFLTSANLYISANVLITVQNWISLTDAWYATSTFSGGLLDRTGSTPENQITFTGFSNNSTTWATVATYGYLEHEIRPVPEPSTYGAIFLSGALGLIAFRRYRRHAAAKTISTPKAE